MTDTEIRFDQITDLKQVRISRQRLLYIHHTGGKTALARANFRSGATFDACLSAMTERIKAQDPLAEGPGPTQE